MNAVYKSEEGARAVEARYRDFLKSWPVANRQLRLPTRQGETFVIACGPESAPPLLLFHGSATNSFIWMDDVADWAEHFRVFAVDMIGEPGFSAPSRPPLDSEAYAHWLDDVMTGLGLTSAAIVGASLGGWLALDYATRRTNRVDALALLCPGGVGRQKMGFLFTALPLLMFGDWGRRKAMEIAMGPIPPEQLSAHAETAEFFALIMEHFRSRTVVLPVFDDEELQRLKMPVLAIVGGEDAILDSDDTRHRLEQNVPQAGICYLPGIGHGILDQTAPILDFLKRATG